MAVLAGLLQRLVAYTPLALMLMLSATVTNAGPKSVPAGAVLPAGTEAGTGGLVETAAIGC